MNNSRLRTLVQISLFAGLMAVCSWIAVPFQIPFTMQTFALFLASGVLGGKKSLAVVMVYILLGVIGLPVFSGGRAGVGALFDLTGGFIVGFLPCAYISGVLCEKTKRPTFMGLSMFAGLICHYIFAVLWICIVYGGYGLTSAISLAILPFIVPDTVKIALAALVSAKIKKHIRA